MNSAVVQKLEALRRELDEAFSMRAHHAFMDLNPLKFNFSIVEDHLTKADEMLVVCSEKLKQMNNPELRESQRLLLEVRKETNESLKKLALALKPVQSQIDALDAELRERP